QNHRKIIEKRIRSPAAVPRDDKFWRSQFEKCFPGYFACYENARRDFREIPAPFELRAPGRKICLRPWHADGYGFFLSAGRRHEPKPFVKQIGMGGDRAGAFHSQKGQESSHMVQMAVTQ